MNQPVVDDELLGSYLENAKRLLRRKFRAAYLALFGADLERASRIVRAAVKGHLNPSFAGYAYYDVICSLNESAKQRCFTMSLIHDKHDKDVLQYVKCLCGSATEVKYFWGSVTKETDRLDWLWKFCSGAGNMPEHASNTIEKVIEIIKNTLEREDKPQEPGDLAEGLYREFYHAKSKAKSGDFKNFGSVLFFYWISLADPERFMPFDTIYCKFFKDKEECKKAFESTKLKAGVYYKVFLNAIYKHVERLDLIDKDRRRLSDGKVRDLLELHAALRAQMLKETSCTS